MSIFGLPLILFNVGDDRDWYQGETISVNKNGINGTILNVDGDSASDITILVNKNGIIGTTTEIV